MKTLKRISALLLAIFLIASFSITAFALDDPNHESGVTVDTVDYLEENASDGSVAENNGNIATNNGPVEKNSGIINDNNSSIKENYGTVWDNNEKGSIKDNYNYVGDNLGTVQDNHNTVSLNSGTVEKNLEGSIVITNDSPKGLVKNNDGTVAVNLGTIEINNYQVTSNEGFVGENTQNAIVYSNSDTVDKNSGTVRDNYGTVFNDGGEVKKNYMNGTVEVAEGATDNGKVVNNYGGTVADGITVENQYFNVNIETENASASQQTNDAGFTRVFDGYSYKYYVKEDGTGTVDVTPDEGFAFNDTSVNSNTSEGLSIDRKSDGSSLKLTFHNLISNIKVKITGFSTSGNVTPSTDPKPTPKPQASSPMFAATCKLKFDLDGGVLDGETELEMKCSAGQRIKLPEAPTKDGFTFVGWETTIRGKTVIFDAGAKFTVTAAKTFTAIWEEN